MCASTHVPAGMPPDIQQLIREERSLRQPQQQLPNEPAFEGTEKRIEIDFAWSEEESDLGARVISRTMWDKILDLCECTIVSHKVLKRFDAYILSESSLFVCADKIIIKTCGTTLLLQGLRTLLDHAVNELGLELEWLFYSRKSFLFPDSQRGVHGSFEDEVSLLREVCKEFGCSTGNAYVLGPLNGDHWIMWNADFKEVDSNYRYDHNLDIMMYDLPADVRSKFFNSTVSSAVADHMSVDSGISSIYPGAQVDAINFTPCGYSCNASLDDGQSFFTIHVTPEESCSYASFETNVRCSSEKLVETIRRAVDVFKPGRFSLTYVADNGIIKELKGKGNSGLLPYEHGVFDKDYKVRATSTYRWELDYQASVSSYVSRRHAVSPSNTLSTIPSSDAISCIEMKPGELVESNLKAAERQGGHGSSEVGSDTGFLSHSPEGEASSTTAVDSTSNEKPEDGGDVDEMLQQQPRRRCRLRVYENDKEIRIESIPEASPVLRRAESDRTAARPQQQDDTGEQQTLIGPLNHSVPPAPLPPPSRRAVSAREATPTGQQQQPPSFVASTPLSKEAQFAKVMSNINGLLDNDEVFAAEEAVRRLLVSTKDEDMARVRRHAVFERFRASMDEVDNLLLKLTDDRGYELRGSREEGKFKIWVNPGYGRVLRTRMSSLLFGDFLMICSAIDAIAFPAKPEVSSIKDLTPFSTVVKATVKMQLMLRRREVVAVKRWFVNEHEGFALLHLRTAAGKDARLTQTDRRTPEMILEDVIILLVPMAENLTFMTRLMAFDPKINLVGFKLMEIMSGRTALKQAEDFEKLLSTPETLKKSEPLPLALRQRLTALSQRRLLPNRVKRRSSLELLGTGWIADAAERWARFNRDTFRKTTRRMLSPSSAGSRITDKGL
ncbi:AMP deaminase [Perkinsus olseni]|uniref:adenosylmethionine decarboxylase n=1 Tax=Perkinsus olseni TaxID=32597 RepID=A0A7J6M8G6_PEROL|nr:AMP deaminase [Perkinsus olseni]